MEYKHKYTRLAYAYITYAVAIICGFVLFSSCSNDDAAQRDGIVRIGIAWRGKPNGDSLHLCHAKAYHLKFLHHQTFVLRW